MAFHYGYVLAEDGRLYNKNILFVNKAESTTFTEELLQLKNHIRQLNAVSEEERSEWEIWLRMCYTFVGTWGTPRVPIDIRIAINNVEEQFGFPMTTFGPDVGAFYT